MDNQVARVSIVTSPDQKGKVNELLSEGNYTRHKNLAVWCGSESSGISDLAVARSEMCLSIPMFGLIESFNLATTSGIVLYEIAKQRRHFASSRKAEKDRVMLALSV